MAETSSRVRLIFEGSESGVVAAATKSAAAIKLLSSQNNQVGKTFQAADKQATKFIGTVTKTAAVTSLVAAGGGLIGQAFVGASAALTELGFASLTVKLGMDGIKKAAEGAKKPFDDLKAAVSGTFEKGLKQPVADIAALLPKLTAGFTGVAASISGMVGQIVRVAASADGVSKLQSILAGTRVFIDGMAPGLARLVDGFLTVASKATPAMRELGAAFGDVFGKLGDVFKNLPFDTVNAAVRGFAATLTGLGSVIASVIDVAIRVGAAFGDSFGVLLNGLADGISKASPGLVDLGSALGDLFRAISPLLPVIGELAGQFAHSLADGIRAVIPYVQEFASWAQNNVGTIKGVAEAVVALALGVKALKIFTSVSGWVSGVADLIGGIGGKAKDADPKVRGFSGAVGGLKAVAGGIALAGIAVGMDKINAASEQGNLSGWNGELHDLARIVTGDWGDALGDIGRQLDQVNQKWQAGQAPVQQWALAVGRAASDAATSVQNFFRGLVGLPPLPPINLDADPAAANAKLGGWRGSASATVGTAILAADPANANTTTTAWAGHARATTGTANLNANPAGANTQLGGWKGRADGTTGTSKLDANPGLATGKVVEWKGRADGTTGTSKLNADPGQANAQTSGWKGNADRTTATAKLSADPGPANAIAQGFYNSWAGRVIRFVLSAVTGSAEGGPVVNGRAGGGPIRGPGTGMSDTAGLYALSNGEHVLTAREVAAAGGHAAIFALRHSLAAGRVPRMTAMRGHAASGGSVSSSRALSIPTPQVSVAVHIGNQEITDIVRTQITHSNRETRRTVGMGAGTTF